MDSETMDIVEVRICMAPLGLQPIVPLSSKSLLGCTLAKSVSPLLAVWPVDKGFGAFTTQTTACLFLFSAAVYSKLWDCDCKIWCKHRWVCRCNEYRTRSFGTCLLCIMAICKSAGARSRDCTWSMVACQCCGMAPLQPSPIKCMQQSRVGPTALSILPSTLA